MNYRPLVLFAAGLASAPALAQSNVTIYGIADVGIGYAKAGDTTFTGIIDGVLSGPRFGFKGSEDLGNGLQAVFVLEQGYSVGSGARASTSRQFHRQARAGLRGGFGTIALGRQYAPGYKYPGRFSAGVPGTVFNSQALLVNSIPGASIHPGTDARWNNSIAYILGKAGGFMAEAIYSFQDDQSGDDRDEDDRAGIGVGYASGPIGVGAVYHYSKRAADDLKEVYVGGSYDFGGTELFASYQTAEAGDVVDAAVAYLGVAIPLGNGKLHTDVGQLSDDRNDDNDTTSVTIGYTHGLSKRTTLYAMVNRMDNDDAAGRGAAFADTEDGESTTSVGLGLRHKF